MPLVIDPQPEDIKRLDWEGFVLAMFSDPAYQRIASATQMQDSRTRIEIFFAVKGSSWELVALLWQGMITAVPQQQRPTEEEAARWQAITDATNMPISFKDGMLRYVPSNDDS